MKESDAQPSAIASLPPWTGRLGRLLEERFGIFVGLVGFFSGTAIFVATSGGVFHDDDLQLIGQAQEHGFSITMLFGESRFLEHLVPVSNALSWVIAVLGTHWWVAHWYAAITTVLLVVLLAFLVLRLTGAPIVALLTSGAVGTSIVIFTVASWWASTALILLMLCAGAAMLILAVRWDDSRSRAAFWGAIAAQLLACGLYDRADLLPVLALAVLVIVRPAGEEITVAGIWRQTKRVYPILVGLFAVVLTQFVLTLLLAGQNSAGLATAQNTTLSGWLDVIANWWIVGVGATLTNGYSGVLHSAGAAFTDPAWLSGFVVLIALAAATIRNRRAAAIWAAAFGFVTLSALQVAGGRLAQAGAVGLASAHRYQELTLFALAVLIPAAWAASGRPRPRSTWGVALLAVITVAATVGWLVSFRSNVRVDFQVTYRAAPYARNLDASLRRWDATGLKLTILDRRVPLSVAIGVPQVEQYALTSKVARIYASGVPVPPLNQPDGLPILADDNGVFRDANLGPPARLDLVGQRCGAAPVGVQWLEPGAVIFAGTIPSAIAQSGNRIALTVRLIRTNGRGQLGVTSSADKFPVLATDLAGYPNGIRTIIPAGGKSTTLQLWNGAAACALSASVAEVRSP